MFLGWHENWSNSNRSLHFTGTICFTLSEGTFFRINQPGRFFEVDRHPSDEKKHSLFTPLPSKRVMPLFPPTFHQAKPDSLEECHLKYPALDTFTNDDGETDDSVAQNFLGEAAIMEVFLTHPHHNIVLYKGCVMQGGNRIFALALQKLGPSLHDKLKSGDQQSFFNVENCYADISAAVEHIHSLGYAHNDIDPSNIMFDGQGRVVLIDFDSCAKEGVEHWKGGTDGWMRTVSEEGLFCPSRLNDYHSLAVLKEFLEDTRNRDAQF